MLEIRAFCRLWKLLVCRSSHVAAYLNQDGFHGEVPLPNTQGRELAKVNLASPLIDAWEIDFADESDFGWAVGVVGAAMYLERVDAILMNTVRWSQYRAVPIGHEEVVAFVEAVRTSLGAQTLLALLQLLQ